MQGANNEVGLRGANLNFTDARPTTVVFFDVDERVVDNILDALDDFGSLPRTCFVLGTCMDRLGGLVQPWSNTLTLVPVLCPPPDEALLEAASLIVENEGFTAGPALWVHKGRVGPDALEAPTLDLHGDDPVAVDRWARNLALAMRCQHGSNARGAWREPAGECVGRLGRASDFLSGVGARRRARAPLTRSAAAQDGCAE